MRVRCGCPAVLSSKHLSYYVAHFTLLFLHWHEDGFERVRKVPDIVVALVGLLGDGERSCPILPRESGFRDC